MKYRKFMGIGPEAVTRRGTPGKWMAALASALLLCACAATEPESEKNIFSDTPVSFDAFGRWDDDASGAADTRTTSNGAETTFDNGDAIGVMAYYLPEGATMDATAPNFMYNQKVTYATSAAAGTTGSASESTSGASGTSAASGSSASGTWAYSPLKYWPVSGKLNFYAYWPYAESGDSHITLSPNTAEGLPTLSYTNKNAYIDLMAAAAEGLSWNGGASAPSVPLTFRHLLARVKFRFTMKTETEDKPVVHILKYDVPYSSGIFRSWDKLDDPSAFWSELGQPATIERSTLNVEGDEITEDGVTIEEFTAYLLPCSFPSKNGTDIENFTISLDNVEHKTSPSSLATVQAGKTYTINFLIEPRKDGKHFITSFSMWEEGDTSWNGELK